MSDKRNPLSPPPNDFELGRQSRILVIVFDVLLISAATNWGTAAFPLEPVPPTHVKGKDEPLELYLVRQS